MTARWLLEFSLCNLKALDNRYEIAIVNLSRINKDTNQDAQQEFKSRET